MDMFACPFSCWLWKQTGVIITDYEELRDSVFLGDDPYLAHVVSESGATQSEKEHLSGTKELAERNCPLEILKNIVISGATGNLAGGNCAF